VLQREAHYVECASRYLKGESQAAIAAALGLEQSTISRYLKTIRGRWAERYTADFQSMVAEELARVDTLEREYWTAWERSCNERTTQAIESTESKSRKSVRKENRDGDPSFLAGVQWCITQRCKLLGLNAPEKREYKHEFADMSDSDLIERAASLLAGVVTEEPASE
jgi:transcriptional regulator with XRE-family HTH domain